MFVYRLKDFVVLKLEVVYLKDNFGVMVRVLEKWDF